MHCDMICNILSVKRQELLFKREGGGGGAGGELGSCRLTLLFSCDDNLLLYFSLRKTIERSVINTGYAYITLGFSFPTLKHRLP